MQENIFSEGLFQFILIIMEYIQNSDVEYVEAEWYNPLTFQRIGFDE